MAATKVATAGAEYVVVDAAAAGNILNAAGGGVGLTPGAPGYDTMTSGGANGEAAQNGSQSQGTNPFGACNTVLQDSTHDYNAYTGPTLDNSCGTVQGNPVQGIPTSNTPITVVFNGTNGGPRLLFKNPA